MAAVLTVHEANIHSMAVNIQILRVGRKQVTMGLFRQLPRGELIDTETMQLRGIPWGHVNYWWDGDGSAVISGAAPRLHVVWQEGDTLQRAVIAASLPNRSTMDYQERLQADINAWMLTWIPQTADVVTHKTRVYDNYGMIDVLRVTLQGKQSYLKLDREDIKIVHAYVQERNNGGLSADLKKSYAAMLESHDLLGTHPQEWLRSWQATQTEYAQKTAAWQRIVTMLRALPQLFIAV